jgi:hypothetical protein
MGDGETVEGEMKKSASFPFFIGVLADYSSLDE